MLINRSRALGGFAAATLAITLASQAGGAVAGSDLDDNRVGAMDDYDVGTTFQATEPVQFSLMYRDHPNYPIQEDWLIFSELEANQNVTFDFVNVPLSDWQQRRAVLIGAGDAPDIIPFTDAGAEVPFVASGAILPISDYVDLMPNFQAKVEEWGLQANIDALRQADGRYYMLPGIHEQSKPQYSFVIRADLFAASGFTEDPATMEEFAEQMATVMADNPDLEYAYSDRWSLNGPIEATINAVAAGFGTAGGWGYSQGTFWDAEAEEFVYTGAMDEYRDMLAWFNGLVTEGLMDPESITQDDDTAIAKFTNEQSAVIGSNDQEILRHREDFESAGIDAELRLITVPAGPAGNIMYVPRHESGLMIAAAAAEKDYFVALLQFVDWLYYSDEGLEFAKWGVEGVTYTVEDDGTRVLAENIDINGLNPGAPEALNTDYGFHNGVFMLAHGSTADLDQSMLRPEVVEFVEAMNAKENRDVAPPIPMTEEEREQAALTAQSLKDHVYQNTAQFILGDRPLDEWDTYVGELEGLGMLEYMDVVNGAVERGFEEG